MGNALDASEGAGLLPEIEVKPTLYTEAKQRVDLNALRLNLVRNDIEPMYLATTLPIETKPELTLIVRLYSWRWGIETFFWTFKQAFRADSWRVFSRREAIDRLLSAAHMAYLILLLLAEFAERGATAAARSLMCRFREVLRRRFARWGQTITFGRFLRLIAMDFPSPIAMARL